MKSPLLWLVTLTLWFVSLDLWAQDTTLRNPAVYARGSSISLTDVSTRASESTLPVAQAGFPSLTSQSGDPQDALKAQSGPERNQFAGPAVTVTSSLAVVLALFAGLVWLARKFGSRSIAPGAIPRDVMESLGSTAIDSRTRVTMLRCGGRVLVFAQSASGIQPLSEITDPEEVRQLMAACKGDSKKTFATTLQSMEKEKPEPGFTGNSAPTHPTRSTHPTHPTARSRGRLFATA